MSSHLVFHIFALIFFSINPTSNAFPALPLPFSRPGTFSNTPLVSGASVDGSTLVSSASFSDGPLVSSASFGGSPLLSNAGFVVDPSSAEQMILPRELVVPSDILGPTMLQEVPLTEAIPGYGKIVKGFSSRASKVKSFLPGNPFKGIFKSKESGEDFVIEEAEAEPKQLTIDPRFFKIAQSAVGALFPIAKDSAPAGFGAAVGAPIGAVMGAKAGAIKGAQVGKALAKQKVEISKKIGEVASEISSKGLAVGKATLNKAVSKITTSSTDIKIKEKIPVKVDKPKSVEASVKIHHPIVGEQFGRIKVETVQPKSTKGSN